MGRELDSERSGITDMDGVHYSDLELASRVRDALLSVTWGHNTGYEKLRSLIHQNKCLASDDVALLVTSLNGISGAVAYIDSSHHATLLDSIFQMNLWDYGPEVMDAIVDLVISLAATNGKHIDSCLAMLVGNFVPPRHFLHKMREPRVYERKRQVFDHVHSALKKITELVPIAPMRLSNIIVQLMPSIFLMETLVAMYVENMLLLERGAIGELIGDLMLVAVMDRLVDIDVEIEVSPDDSSKGIFEMELEDVDEDMLDYNLEDDKLHEVSSSSKKVRFSETLDSLLVLMFEHLRLCQERGRLNKVFEILLGSFETTVLGTYKSKFSQFVVFYACSLDPESCGTRFAHMLLNIFTGTNKTLIRRMGAIAYLASYLSRAKFLPLPFVVDILQRLVNWCLEYCEKYNGDINTEAHRVFYSGCQAMLYVLCFRMQSMMDSDNFKMQLYRVDKILRHSLNPLKVCLPSIVEEFEKQANATGLFTVSNGGDYLNSEQLFRAFGGTERLDMFFPFDPCLLKKSDSYIRPHFIFWSMVKPMNDDDNESKANSEDEEESEGNSMVDDESETNSEEESEANTMEDDESEANNEEEDGEHDRTTVVGDYSMAETNKENNLNDFNNMFIIPKSSLLDQFGSKRNGAKRMPSRIKPSKSP